MTLALQFTKRTWFSVALVAFFGALLLGTSAFAADLDGDCFDDTTGAAVPGCTDATGDTFGVSVFEDEIALGDQELSVTIARIINVALSLLGIVAVVIILIGGFQWMTAGGNEEKVSGARKLIFAGIIGLAIILSAFAIARFVLASLSEATGTGTLTP